MKNPFLHTQEFSTG